MKKKSNPRSLNYSFSFIWILLAVLFQTSAAIFSKKAAMVGKDQSIIISLFTPWYLGTLTCLGLQAGVWIKALRHYQLSFAYPFMSIVRGLVLCAAWIFFHEPIQLNEIFGIFIIMVGIIIVGNRVQL